MWEDLVLTFISFLHTSQYHVLLLFLCLFDCKWIILFARFFYLFTLLTIILVICCKMCVVWIMVIFFIPFILQIRSWTMLHLYSINLLKCFCSIVKLLILCSPVFVSVSEKIYFNLSHKNIYTLTLIHVIIFIIHTYINVFVYQFFIKISQNHDYIQTYYNNRRKTFHFACRQWYSYNNPGILTWIRIRIVLYVFIYLYE